MKNVLELICLYHDVNFKVLSNGNTKCELFRRFTNTLADIIHVLKTTEVELSEKQKELVTRYGEHEGEVTVFNYFEVFGRVN